MLRESQDYVSGQQICERFQVSRTAVWKVIKQLKEEGYEVEAVRNRGYRLSSLPDILSREEIVSQIDTVWAGQNVYYLQKQIPPIFRRKEWEIRGRLTELWQQQDSRLPEKAEEEEPGSLRRIKNIYMSLLFASGDRTGQSTHVDSGYGICGCNALRECTGLGCTD